MLLADEPTGNLDSTTGDEIIEVLARLADDAHQTIVLITHDTAIAERTHRVVRMRDGQVVLGGAAAVDAPELLETS